MTEKSQTRIEERRGSKLYSLPDSWQWITINDAAAPGKHAIVDGPFGSNLKVSDYVENGSIPVLTTKNLEGNYEDVRYITEKKFEQLKRSAVSGGDILVAKIGSCGKTGIYPLNMPPAMIPANLLKVTLNEHFDRKYVYNYFNSPFFQRTLKGIIKATAQPAFGVTNFRNLPLPFAPFNEQKRIVSEIEKQFSRLDEAVVSLKRTEAKLKRYKAAVLKAAVEGKLTEQWRKEHPDVEPAGKLLERILIERRKKWEQTERTKMKAEREDAKDDEWKEKYKSPKSSDYESLPSLPSGWHWASTDELFWFVTSGSRGWAKYYSDSGPLFLRVGNLDHNTVALDLKDKQRVRPPEGAEGTRTRVEPKDILISITADVGMSAVVPEEFEEAFINQHIALAKPVRLVESGYIAWYLASGPGQKQFQNLQRGATKAGLGLNDIRSVNIPLPPLDEQKEIVSEIERRLSIVDEAKRGVDLNLSRGDRLRQSILKKAFTGKLVTIDRRLDSVEELAVTNGVSR